MRIAMAQVNPTLGAFAENKSKILQVIESAVRSGCDLVVFPELTLMGYPPIDLLERPSFVDAQNQELERLLRDIPNGITALVGAITHTETKTGKPYYNSALLVQRGQVLQAFHKQLLPAYDVFDESRHIASGELEKNHFTLNGVHVQVTICEDIWPWSLPELPSPYSQNPYESIEPGSCDLIVNLSASPFAVGKESIRYQMACRTAAHQQAPLIYINQVGAQDELVFDGGSFAIQSDGRVIQRADFFKEDLTVVEWQSAGSLTPVPLECTAFSGKVSETSKPKGSVTDATSGFRIEGHSHSEAELIRHALVLGIRDFCEKTGFKKLHLGSSGGIDSAVVACLACDALGAENVVTLGLPGPFNAPESLSLARRLAENLGCGWYEIPIESPYQDVTGLIEKTFGEQTFGVVHENIQARLRGLFLMAYSNMNHSLLLATSNKSEFASGYSTLYGDMCGGLCPIGDLLKGQVYALAELYNKSKEIIPKRIIEREPSAELRPNQRDQDSLPPYDVLDESVRRLVEHRRPPQDESDRWLLRALMKSEFKRWQAPPILKVSHHAFGRGRRLPISQKGLF